MFSALGHIFFNQPRHAESTDARLGIQRHDPEQEQRRKNTKDDDASGFADEDNAIVSVEALRIFLENLLNTQQTAANAQSGSSPIEVPQNASTVPVENAQAISAYQATARTSPAPVTARESSGVGLKLEAHELRMIYKLLEDLKQAGELKIEFVRIERSDTFLDSLQAAVAKALYQQS